MSDFVVEPTIGAAMRRLSLPTAITILGDQLLGVVDTIAIGKLGTVALAGVTGASTVFLALGFSVAGFFSGLSIIAAQRIGARDLENFARAVRAGMVIPLAVSLVIAVISIPLAFPVVSAMVGALPSAHASSVYLILRCFSLLPIAISSALVVGLGAAGNRMLGVIVLAIINIVHIPLVLILALGLGTHRPLGIEGAGISSLLSETIACVYAVIYTWRRPLYRVFSSLTISLKLAWECARLGLPEVAFLFAVIAPDSFIVAMLAPLGPTVISAFRALNVVSDLTFVVPSPLQSATQTVIGQRLGAHDIEGARRFFSRARNVSFWLTSLTGAICAALAWPLSFAFTLNAAVASVAALPLALHMVTLPLKGYSMVSLAPIRAAGDTRFSMIIGILTGILVLPISYLCIRVFHIGLFGVPIAWIVAWCLRTVVTAVKLRDESWTRRELISVT